jgi:hypothetical protein
LSHCPDDNASLVSRENANEPDKHSLVTGEDGRAGLEAIFAAYESERTGRKVELPFKTGAKKPHDLWKPAK